MLLDARVTKLERVDAAMGPTPKEAAAAAEREAMLVQGIAEVTAMLGRGLTADDIVDYYCEGTTGERRAIIGDIARELLHLAALAETGLLFPAPGTIIRGSTEPF